jgi:hypothetical protein
MMGHLPSWIQAIADVALVAVTTYTLIVLRRYAADTKTIAKNSSDQNENAQMPFVALVLRSESSLSPGTSSSPWAIRNQGSGAAINIYFTRFVGNDKPPIMQWMTPLGPGEECVVARESGEVLQKNGFTVECESLSGKKYRTISKRVDSDLKTTFHKLG